MPDPAELDGLVAAASAVLDGVLPDFVAGLGADPQVTKGVGDYATALDYELEDRITAGLVERTGVPVHGEERGGPDLRSGTAWVLDPIDGTVNYSLRVPLTGVLLALVSDGEPVAALTWLPLLGSRLTARAGGPLVVDGAPRPPLAPAQLRSTAVGFGPVRRGSPAQSFPTGYRFALLHAVTEHTLRVRMLGSTGLDLAWVADGVLGGAVVFGHHPWDNAAGACLVRAAGGTVTDLAGEPWRLDSRGVVAAAPGVHAELLDVVRSLGDPDAHPDDGAVRPVR